MDTRASAQFLGFLLLWFPGARCDVQMTPSPMSASLGETIILNCQGSQDISSYLSWYQQKPGKTPQPLIYGTTNWEDGVQSRFSGSGSGTDFTFKIRRMQHGDLQVYYHM
ncbi:mCG1037963 [Mus musculus]|nr:mCG1037963 [Mus musculus]